MANIVTTLLDHDGREYDAFTLVTMDLSEESGIEPDYCFYIDNWAAVSGKKQINWRQDPPPDLVIEIDVPSYSSVDDYLPYRVLEVWLFRNQQLLIYRFQDLDYTLHDRSLYFPDIQIHEIIACGLKITYERNTSAVIRNLKQDLENSSPV